MPSNVNGREVVTGMGERCEPIKYIHHQAKEKSEAEGRVHKSAKLLQLALSSPALLTLLIGCSVVSSTGALLA